MKSDDSAPANPQPLPDWCKTTPRPVLPLEYHIAVPTLPHLQTAAVVALHLLTASLFSVVWFNALHDKLPRTRKDDPSAFAAIVLLFVPIINFYWVFFTWLRLCDRIAEQRELLGLARSDCKPICIFCCILMFVPFVNIISIFIIQPFFFAALQRDVNDVYTLGVVRAGNSPPSPQP